MVRVADSLLSTSDRYRGANEVILRSGQRLAADTGTMDGGISYTLRISDLDEVPVVTNVHDRNSSPQSPPMRT